MVNHSFRTVQDLIDFVEAAGYTFNRSTGSHKIYSALNKKNVVLVWHNNPRKERPHPRAIKDILQLISS